MPPRHCTASPQPDRAVKPGSLCAVLLCGLLLSGQAAAQTMTLEQAVRTAQQQVPGKLVTATTEHRGTQTVYRIRILGADGIVRTVMIDASAKP